MKDFCAFIRLCLKDFITFLVGLCHFLKVLHFNRLEKKEERKREKRMKMTESKKGKVGILNVLS